MSNADSFIKTGNQEYIKTYTVYDVNGNPTTIYEARANTKNGEPCLRTDLTYVGITSQVEKTREVDDTWLTAYDIP